MRKAGIRVSTHNLTFAADTNGAHQVTLDGAVLEGPYSALFDDCTIEYRDRLHVEWTAEELSMRPHRVHARTTITTSQLRVEVMIANWLSTDSMCSTSLTSTSHYWMIVLS